MDKELLEALNNLSLSLDEIAKALKKESTSAVSSALKGGNFTKSLESISKEIVQISKDTAQIKKDQSQILSSQNTIIKMISDIRSEKTPTVEKSITSPTTVKEVGKSKEEESKSLFGGASKDSSKIKDGVATIVLIAAGVLAIGMAFKLIGKIDIASVLALSLALPLIAMAFQKISEMKLKPSEIGGLILLTVGMSTAITLSSFILGMVQPIGIPQALTAILIAGVFSGISFGMSKLLMSIKSTGISGAAAIGVSFLLPILMIGFSAAIAGSSFFLGMVKPVGLFQGITAILISAVFVGLSYSLGKIVTSLKGISPTTALVAALVSPILLVALSAAIAGASIFLGEVKPVGLFQALTAILISAVFAALSYGINKIVTAFKGLGPATLAAAAIGAPIILIAMSYAVMKSSEFLGEVKPIGIFQALSAILISAVFTVLGFGIKKMLQGFQGVSPSTAIVAGITLPIILIALSYAIKVSSEWLSEVKTIGISQFFTAVGISIIFVTLSFSVKPIMKGIQGVSYGDITKGVVVLLAITAAVVAGSYIIDKIKPISFAQGITFIGVAIAIGVGALITAAVLKGLNKIGKEKEYIEGGKSLLIIAGVVSASSIILSVGNYSNAPGYEWSLKTAISLAIFGVAVWALKKLPVGIKDVAVGALSLILIAGTIWATSHIISDGDYSKYPSMDWIQNVSLGLGIFALGAGAIGAIILGTAGLAAGALALGLAAIAGIAFGMVETDKILAGGDFSKYPSEGWVKGTSFAITRFAKLIFAIGGTDALGGLLSTITFGAFKDPLTAGIAAAKLMSQTMVEINEIFKSPFDNFPKNEWVNGTSLAIGNFSKLISVISDISGKNLESGINGIESISNAIVKSSKILSGGKYEGGPTSTWSSNVSSALKAFFPIYKMLIAEQFMSIFGMGVSTDQFVMSIDAISSGIVETAKKFDKNKASFKDGPTKEWAEAMQIALGAFSPIYKMLVNEKLMNIFGMGISVKDYTMAIETISGGIVTAATKFQENKASFVEGPKKEWAEGVAIALGAFSPIYSILMKEKLMNYFLEGSGVSAESYKTAIETISGGIVTAANKFNEFKASFVEGPKKEWAEGVAIALEAFSPIYGYLMKENLMNYFLPGSGVSAESYKNAIVTISQGIITAAGTLKDGGGTYEAGPKKEWAEGVALALGGFSQIFEILSNGSFWSDPVTGEQLGTAIQTIAKSLVEVSKTLGGEGVTFDKDKAPTKEWSEGVKLSLEAFGSIFGFVSENSGWFGSDSSELSSAIVLIGTSIMLTSKQLALGTYTLIDEKWPGATKTVIETFINLLGKIEENDLDDLEDIAELVGSLKMVSLSILTTSIILSKGSYVNIIDDKWVKGVKKTIVGFIDLMKEFGDFDIESIETSKTTVNGIILSIVNISKKFEEIKLTENLPTDDWIQTINTSIEKVAKFITNIGLTISQEQIDTGSLMIRSILLTIKNIGDRIQKMKFPPPPTEEWNKGVEKTIKSFGSLAIYVAENFGIVELGEGIFKINRVTGAIWDIAKRFATLNFTKFPDAKWNAGVLISSISIAVLMKRMNKLISLSETRDGSEKMKLIVKSIFYVDQFFSKMDLKKTIDSSWTGPLSAIISTFTSAILNLSSLSDSDFTQGESNINKIASLASTIPDKFSKVKVDDKTISSIGSMVGLLNGLSSILQMQSDPKGSSIDGMSDSFDRLSKSIERVGGAISGLDLTKLQSLSGIKSGSILINLINEEQFQNLINQIETRNSQFVQAVKGKSGEAPSVTISKSGPTSIETETNSADVQSQILTVLQDIQLVIGSGKTVDTYVKDKSSDFNLNPKGKR